MYRLPYNVAPHPKVKQKQMSLHILVHSGQDLKCKTPSCLFTNIIILKRVNMKAISIGI